MHCDLRIAVHDISDYPASGMSEAAILKEFPELCGSDIRACITFAADRERLLAGAVKT